MSVRLDLLFQHCADLGLDVEWHNLGPTRRGDYCAGAKVIRLNDLLTRAQATACLAHEVAHAIHGDQHSTNAIEARADETGASLVITPNEYSEAEALVGPHAGALARELEVTKRMILAWRRWYGRSYSERGMAHGLA